MSIVLKNALLCDIDSPRVEKGCLRIDDRQIVERGTDLAVQPGDEIVDCDGCAVLPGLVNGHTHLYSALAVGMPPPPKTPENFLEILQSVWWRLDQALDAESIEMSARIGALEAVRCGTTTLIDHHASPNHIEGSLDLIEKGIGDVGLRGVLCYETTDRHGRDGRLAGLDENRRYLQMCGERGRRRFAGMAGAHASFTLDDETLTQLATLAAEGETGVHIHVAEDPCDEEQCQSDHQTFLIDRLTGYGLLRPESVFAHCTHLDPDSVAQVSGAGVTVVHNPRSNMNNSVGYAPVPHFRCPVMLGTDGIGSDMFAEAKAAWYASRLAGAGLRPNDVVAMMAASARRASQALGVTLGRLEEDAAADLVVTDYRPATAMTSENLAAHIIFALQSRHVRDVMIDGRWAMRARQIESCDEAEQRRVAVEVSNALWRRIAEIPCS